MGLSGRMSDAKCFRPKIRVHIAGCKQLGSTDMIVSYYNEEVVERMKTHIYMWFLIGNLLQNDDIATLIVKCIINLPLVSPQFDSSIFEEIIKHFVDLTNTTLSYRDIRYNRDKMIDEMCPIISLFTDMDEKVVDSVSIDQDKWYIRQNGEFIEFYDGPRRTTVIETNLSILIAAILFTLSDVEVTVHSHRRHSLFKACTLLVSAQGCETIETIVDSTFWLKKGGYLGVIDCEYCKIEKKKKESPKPQTDSSCYQQ